MKQTTTFARSLLLTAALAMATTAVAQTTVTFTVDTENGTLTANNSASAYNNTWTSSQTNPQLTLTVGANNMNADSDGTINLYLGTNESGYVYTLATSRGWLIEGYSFDFTNSNTSVNMTVTPSGGEAVTCEGSGTATVAVADINAQTASFTLSNSTNANQAACTSNFTVTVVSDTTATETASTTTLFTTTSGASFRYRIPAITRMEDGSLLAIADYRWTTGDIGYGHIDIVGRISSDNGATWDEEFIIADGSGTSGANDCGYGDAALVTDSATGRVLMICCAGNRAYQSSTRSNPLRTARLYSDDGGKTWTTPEDITEDIYGLFDTESGSSIAGLFFGSGRIAQSSLVKVGDYYRVYAALCTRSGNRVVYSDDFGQTWQILGGINAAPAPSGDEPKCEELPDGSVVLSSRKSSGRYFNVFTFTDLENAEGSWSSAVASNNITGGISVGGNSTNGEILIVPAVRNADSKEVYLALQSLPFAGDRSNVGIWYKGLETFSDFDTPTNFASDWDGSYQVSYTSSAYSTMMMQADGKLAFVYEETSVNSGYNIIYTPLSIETITNNAYSLSASVDRWSLLAGSIDEKSDLTPGTFVGQLTEEGADVIQSYVDAFVSSPSLESYYAIVAQTAAPENLLQLDPAKIYRIYNVRAGEYINAANLRRTTSGSITGSVVTGGASGEDALPTLWQFESDGEATYRLRNLNADAYYLAATESGSVTDISGASVFEVGEGASTDNWTLYVTNGSSLDSYTYLNAFYQSSNPVHTIGTWSGGSSDEGNLWMIELVDSVTLAVGEGGYAAVTYPVAVQLPEGLTAYSLDQETSNYLIVKAMDTDVLPAGTPALLGGATGNYTLSMLPDNADEAPATGFEGVTMITVTGTSANLYTLDTQDDVAGMAAHTATTMAANTTYYATTTDGIDFFTLATEIPVGIGNVNADTAGDAPATYYDLGGRKVSKPARGIYVTSDGKKVLFK